MSGDTSCVRGLVVVRCIALRRDTHGKSEAASMRQRHYHSVI